MVFTDTIACSNTTSLSLRMQCIVPQVLLHVAQDDEENLEKSAALHGSFVIGERGVLDVGHHAVLQNGSALLQGAISHECAFGDNSCHVAARSCPHYKSHMLAMS